MNTLGAQDNVEFAGLIDRLLADETVKGIVLTSDKRDFLAGGDLDAVASRARRRRTRSRS